MGGGEGGVRLASPIETSCGKEQRNGFGTEQPNDFGTEQPNDFGTEQHNDFGTEQRNDFGTEQRNDFGTEQRNAFGTYYYANPPRKIRLYVFGSALVSSEILETYY